MTDSEIVVLAHNIRSTHNIGSIFRSCDGFGVKKIILSGYTPYPQMPDDSRLPHLALKISKQINKTALGAERSVAWQKVDNFESSINEYTSMGFKVIGLEQNANSIPINKLVPPKKTFLILGEEIDGVNESLLRYCDQIVEIPMSGSKESFNVSVACGIALYKLRFN